jgi:hypothetical protein
VITDPSSAVARRLESATAAAAAGIAFRKDRLLDVTA